MKTAVFIRKAVQLFFLLLFVYLLSRNRYPLNFFLPTDFFLRIDPLSAISVMVAGRVVAIKFWPALVVIISTIIMGRFFCGWVCPLGTTLDISDRVLTLPKKEVNAHRFGCIKYLLLIAILVCAVFSFQFIFFFDPLALITRTTAIALFPIFYFLVEGLLAGLSYLPLLGDFFFDLYVSAKGTILPVQEQSFFQNLPVIAIFLTVILLEKVSRRFWCRNLCPLGALLGLLSKNSLFGRTVDNNCNFCADCSGECKMGIIDEENMSSSRAECILCLNCGKICPEGDIDFKFGRGEKGASKIDISRRRFLTAAASGLAALGLYRTSPLNLNASERAIRPPGAVEEEKFLDLCLRCHQCVGICSTTGGCLQPAVGQFGLEGLWTPVARMREGYCEFNCNLCGEVCPSGAISPLDVAVKRKTVMGTAYFDHSRCIPYYRAEECLVCEEYCPTPEKAIKFRSSQVEKNGEIIMLKLPYVDEKLCIGCGICEHKCPVEGKAGIFITRARESRV